MSSLVLLILVLAVTYALSCVWFPLRVCRACDGHGKFASSTFRRAVRLCARCNGKGLERRTGRRLYESWQRNRRRKRR